MRRLKLFPLTCAVIASMSFAALSANGSDTAYSPVVAQNTNPRLKAQITLVAKDANLSEVLKTLSERSGMNFVAGEGVYREKITLILNKTPLDEAIDILVRAVGLSYEIIGNSILIAEPDKLKGEVGYSSYVVELRYAQAEEVAGMLGDLTKNVKIDKAGNRLICYTSPRVILEIERIVKSIDHPHVLVLLETRLIEVSSSAADKYGINWNDFSPIQSGISHPQTRLQDAFRAGNWLQMPIDFNLTLDMLIESGDARVLMDSKLTTTNNREAKLHIGEVIPYVIQSYNQSGAGTNSSQQVEKEEVGVIVTMTPHINEKAQITLALAPEVSNIVDWKGPAADIPLVRVRKTTTTVRVEDGQTIFLAGLLSEENTVTTTKLPVLGEIPLIGMLFQHKREDVKRTNLIIEVTPRIIRDPADLDLSKEDSSETESSEPVETEEEESLIQPSPEPAPAATAQKPAEAAPAAEPAPAPAPAPVAKPQ